MKTLRQKLQEKIGDALDIISLMLGVTQHNKQGNVTGSSTNREVLNAVLDFAEAYNDFGSEHQKGINTQAEDMEDEINSNGTNFAHAMEQAYDRSPRIASVAVSCIF